MIDTLRERMVKLLERDPEHVHQFGPLQSFGMASAEFDAPSWRDRMLSGKPVPTQHLAE